MTDATTTRAEVRIACECGGYHWARVVGGAFAFECTSASASSATCGQLCPGHEGEVDWVHRCVVLGPHAEHVYACEPLERAKPPEHVYEGRISFRYAGRGTTLDDVPDDEPLSLARWVAAKVLPGQEDAPYYGDARIRLTVEVLE